MRTLAIPVRPKRQHGRPYDIASLLSTDSLYVPSMHDLPRQVDEGVGEQSVDQPPFPTVVEVCDGGQSPWRSLTGGPHHQTKTFAELQQILIQNDLVGAAADRARAHAERGESDAVTRLRASGNDANR
jgi:hypothetical protein